MSEGRSPGTDLRSLRLEIQREHEAAERSINEALDHARSCGDLLHEAKRRVGHGGWMDWVADNFAGSHRTARRYMRIADRWEEIQAKRTRVADLGIRDADNLLSEPRDSEDEDDSRDGPTSTGSGEHPETRPAQPNTPPGASPAGTDRPESQPEDTPSEKSEAAGATSGGEEFTASKPDFDGEVEVEPGDETIHVEDESPAPDLTWMADWRPDRKMRVRSALAEIPEAERADVANLVQSIATNSEGARVAAFENLAAMGSERRQEAIRLHQSDSPEDRSRAITMATDQPKMPDPMISGLASIINDLSKWVRKAEDDSVQAELKEVRGQLITLRTRIKKQDQQERAA